MLLALVRFFSGCFDVCHFDYGSVCWYVSGHFFSGRYVIDNAEKIEWPPHTDSFNRFMAMGFIFEAPAIAKQKKKIPFPQSVECAAIFPHSRNEWLLCYRLLHTSSIFFFSTHRAFFFFLFSRQVDKSLCVCALYRTNG